MAKTRYEKFNEVMKMALNDALTLPQAKKLVEVLVEKLKNEADRLRLDTTAKNIEVKKELNKAILSLQETEKKLVSAEKQTAKVSKEVMGLVKQSFREIDDIRKDIPELPNLSRYITVDNINEYLPEIPELQPETPKGIRDKLETLKGKERLDKSAIRGLDEEIEEIEKKISSIPRGAVGGGVTNARIQQAFKYILKTESPVGDIDGNNTEYTVSQPIFAVFAFSLNGEVIAQLPNYTISGNKITFSTALPGAYSGKDFEVKYI